MLSSIISNSCLKGLIDATASLAFVATENFK